jgi:hypothetical protein
MNYKAGNNKRRRINSAFENPEETDDSFEKRNQSQVKLEMMDR